MGIVKITLAGGQVHCITPYSPVFPAAAKDMGGRWNAPAWVFDARDEQRVRDLCLDLFGTDGAPCELVTLRVIHDQVTYDRAGSERELYLAGRQVARVFSKTDSRAKLGDGVVMVQGRFRGAGSTKNPYISAQEGTIFELRDIPLLMAQRIKEKSPEAVEIIGSPFSPAPESIQVDPRRAALLEERAAILARLEQLEAQLIELPVTAPPARVFEVCNELLDND